RAYPGVAPKPNREPPLHSHCRAVSSAGRAPALQAGGRRFDPVTAHSRTRRHAPTAWLSQATRATRALSAIACSPRGRPQPKPAARARVDATTRADGARAQVWRALAPCPTSLKTLGGEGPPPGPAPLAPLSGEGRVPASRTYVRARENRRCRLRAAVGG